MVYIAIYFKSPKTYGEGATEKIRYAAERTADAAEQRNKQIRDEYEKYKSRRQGRGNRGKPGSPTTTDITPYTKSRAYTSDEYKGVTGKIRHAVAETSFIGDTVESGEDVSEEYKRWKRGEFPKTRIYKL